MHGQNLELGLQRVKPVHSTDLGAACWPEEAALGEGCSTLLILADKRPKSWEWWRTPLGMCLPSCLPACMLSTLPVFLPGCGRVVQLVTRWSPEPISFFCRFLSLQYWTKPEPPPRFDLACLVLPSYLPASRYAGDTTRSRQRVQSAACCFPSTPAWNQSWRLSYQSRCSVLTNSCVGIL